MYDLATLPPRGVRPEPRVVNANRKATVLLLAGGLGLLGLMAYALTLGGDWSARLGLNRGPVVFEVAVFYPDSASWRDITNGAQACVTRGVFTKLDARGSELSLHLPRTGRAILLRRYPARGTVDTRESLERALANQPAPLAIVGSSNTVLTLALARSLDELTESASEASRPVLLIPAATSVFLPDEGNGNPKRLLDVYPGRSFRFCLNDNGLAELAVRYRVEACGETPAKVRILADPRDPFSEDLAHSFEAELSKIGVVAEAQRVDVSPAPDAAGGVPTFEDMQLATGLIKEAADLKPDRPLWIVLTLQGDPARRILTALGRGSTGQAAGPIRILAGDGLGLPSLERLVGKLEVSATCASSLSPGRSDDPRHSDRVTAQVAEDWLTALAAALDTPTAPTDLAAALAKGANQSAPSDASGRTIAFENGERVGRSLGSVLVLHPEEQGSAPLEAYSRDDAGVWRGFTWSEGRWEPLRADDAP